MGLPSETVKRQPWMASRGFNSQAGTLIERIACEGRSGGTRCTHAGWTYFVLVINLYHSLDHFSRRQIDVACFFFLLQNIMNKY